MEVIHSAHVGAGEGNDDARSREAGGVGGTARGYISAEDGARRGEVAHLHSPPRELNRLPADADPSPLHPALADQLRNDDVGSADRNREADALRSGDDRGVDADDVAARVDERPAGVSGVERGVRLNDRIDETAGL